MKWKIFNPAIIALLVILCVVFLSDGEIYLITSLMALAIMGVIHRYRPAVMRITRWAKANPQKSQWIITGLQLAIMLLGIIAGKNFEESGIKLPYSAAYVFSALMLIGFLSVNFKFKRSTIAIPREVNRNRLVYTVIALSSFALAVFAGNRIGDRFPNSPITHLIEAIDRALLPEESIVFAGPDDGAPEPAHVKNLKQDFRNESSVMIAFAAVGVNDKEDITPNEKENITSYDEKELGSDENNEIISDERKEVAPGTDLKKDKKANFRAEKKMKKFEKKKARLMHRLEKRRVALAAALTGGAVLLIILLVLLACSGLCLVIGGVALIAEGSFGGILAILAGIGLGWLAIREIGRVSKRDKERTEAKEKADQKAKENL